MDFKFAKMGCGGDCVCADGWLLCRKALLDGGDGSDGSSCDRGRFLLGSPCWGVGEEGEWRNRD